MNRQKWILLAVALGLMSTGAFALVHMKANYRLGAPGVTTKEIAGSPRLNVYLPAKVLDYDSIEVPADDGLLTYMPKDTSFGERKYFAPDGRWVQCNVVLMGTDRTSIHKPQFCLTGSGWNIDDAESAADKIRIEKPHPYDLPVMRLVTSHETKLPGRDQPSIVRGIFVYWFVAKDELTESHWVRMRNMSTHLLATGELERWAYVFCFTACAPGQEARAYDELKRFIAGSVPQFQKTTGPRAAQLVSSGTTRP